MGEKNGGSAFPIADQRGPNGEGWAQGSPGMSLRDWFAGQVLQGFLTQEAERAFPASIWAASSYEMADAMLAERDRERT